TTLYKLNLTPPRAGCETPPSSCYTALVYPHVQGGEQIGEEPFGAKLRFYAGTPDDQFGIFRSEVKLFDQATAENGLYEWSADGTLRFVGGLPGLDEPFKEEEFGVSPSLGAPALNEGGVMRNAISPDGRRVIWSLAGAQEQFGALYLTDTQTEQTMRIDRPQG